MKSQLLITGDMAVFEMTAESQFEMETLARLAQSFPVRDVGLSIGTKTYSSQPISAVMKVLFSPAPPIPEPTQEQIDACKP